MNRGFLRAFPQPASAGVVALALFGVELPTLAKAKGLRISPPSKFA
jgi:hypothetical protein